MGSQFSFSLREREKPGENNLPSRLPCMSNILNKIHNPIIVAILQIGYCLGNYGDRSQSNLNLAHKSFFWTCCNKSNDLALMGLGFKAYLTKGIYQVLLYLVLDQPVEHSLLNIKT